MNTKILAAGAMVIVAAGAVIIYNTSVLPVNETPQLPDSLITPTYGAPVEQIESNSYVPYSPQAFDAATNQRRVYFFHAPWCPTCKAANEDFTKNEAKIPQNVIVFQTDYDKQTALKKQYGITYQHTFVQVDAQGNEVAKWNGGGIAELLTHLK